MGYVMPGARIGYHSDTCFIHKIEIHAGCFHIIMRRPVQQCEITFIIFNQCRMASTQPASAIRIDNVADMFEGRDMGVPADNTIDMFAARLAKDRLFKIIDEMQGLLSLLANKFSQ